MKYKYITKQILEACGAKPLNTKKDIHAQLQDTIAERRIILREFEKLFPPKSPEIQKDIHAQLKETIAEHRRIMRQWEKFFQPKKENSLERREKKLPDRGNLLRIKKRIIWKPFLRWASFF